MSSIRGMPQCHALARCIRLAHVELQKASVWQPRADDLLDVAKILDGFGQRARDAFDERRFDARARVGSQEIDHACEPPSHQVLVYEFSPAQLAVVQQRSHLGVRVDHLSHLLQ